jgi:hypothetical protein
VTSTEFGVLSRHLPGLKKTTKQTLGNLPGDRNVNLKYPEYGPSVPST